MTWLPLAVLANVQLQSPIGNDVAALVRAGDRRLAALKRRHRNFRRFLNCFSDSFGTRFAPAVLLVRDDVSPAFRNVAAVASFRDLIAVSAVIHGRVQELRGRTGRGAVYGETFALYPWMIDRHFEDLISRTPAQLGIHEVGAFKGQSSPHLHRVQLADGDLDEPLLKMLMARWSRHYGSENPDWSDRALFRSLNMAYQACLMPAGVDTTIFDLGRILGLWVAAFEILTNTGRRRSGRARERVFDLIERTWWLIADNAARTRRTGRQEAPVQRTFASWLYQELNNHRNDFLHGEPVEPDQLNLPVPQRSILDYAAPLYRMALTAFLPLQRQEPLPPLTDAEAFGAAVALRREHEEHQKIVEEALQTAARLPRARATTSRALRRLAVRPGRPRAGRGPSSRATQRPGP